MPDEAPEQPRQPASGPEHPDWTRGHQQHHADRERRVESAYKCLRLLRGLVSFDRVVDFGCGIGAWLEAARLLGASSLTGIEGEWIRSAETIVPQDWIKVLDLATAKVDLGKRFDLALTIEVAEHLPESAADLFCQNLVRASDRIVFSAALPGQGGLGHVNEKPLLYWVRRFWGHGYVPLEPFRPYIASDRSIYPWLRQNLVMFVAYDQLIRDPGLLRFARPLADFGLHYDPRRAS